MRACEQFGNLRQRPLRLALLASAAFIVAGSAIAQMGIGAPGTEAPLRMRSDYFGYAASVSPRAGYSDNIELQPKGAEQSTALLSTLFSGAAIYSKSRFTGVINGQVDGSFRTDNSDAFINQNVGAAGTFTVADNVAYVDVAGSTSRQLVGENARFSSNLSAARGQRADVHNFAVSPYLYRQFSDRSSAQLRYRYSQVFVDDDSADANPFSGNFFNDSRSHEVLASYDTGGKFQQARVVLSAYGADTTEDGSVIFPRQEYRQGSLLGEVQVAVTPTFAVSGAIGYDEIDTEATPGLFDDEALSGLFWRAGFTARPGRRSSIRVEYGRRYDDDFIDAAITYDISGRLRFVAGAGQTFETRTQSISSTITNQQRQILEFAERLREGAEMSPDGVIATANRFVNNNVYGQTAGIGVSKNAYAQISGAYDRTEIGLGVRYQDTDFGFRQNEYLMINGDIRRELSRKLSAYANVFYRATQTDFDPLTCVTQPFLFGFDVNSPLFDPVAACNQFAIDNGETDTIGGRIGVSYRLYENLSLFGEYGHTSRFGEFETLEYGENTVLGGLTLDF